MGETVPQAVESLLTGDPVVAHFGTCTDGRPHVAPVWYNYSGEDTVEVMTTGRKLANVEANPLVALSLQAGEAGDPDWHVTLRGTATVVDDADETRAANRRINRRYGADDPDAWLEENTLVRVDVGSVSHRTY